MAIGLKCLTHEPLKLCLEWAAASKQIILYHMKKSKPGNNKNKKQRQRKENRPEPQNARQKPRGKKSNDKTTESHPIQTET